MSRPKPEELKKHPLCVSVPRSFAAWCQRQDDGASILLQQAIAERVVGVPLSRFEETYATGTRADSRRNHGAKDSIRAEYRRAARWMLESVIHGGSVYGDRVFLDVEWTITGERTLVAIDIQQPGFRHVLYDDVMYEPIVMAKHQTFLTEAGAGEGDLMEWFPLRNPAEDFKLAVVRNWIGLRMTVKKEDR
jgi:hypothetical protein